MRSATETSTTDLPTQPSIPSTVSEPLLVPLHIEYKGFFTNDGAFGVSVATNIVVNNHDAAKSLSIIHQVQPGSRVLRLFCNAVEKTTFRDPIVRVLVPKTKNGFLDVAQWEINVKGGGRNVATIYCDRLRGGFGLKWNEEKQPKSVNVRVLANTPLTEYLWR